MVLGLGLFLCSAYTIVQSTTHSLAIDVLTDPANDIGSLFLSDAEGIYFVEALSNTNRNDLGFVDFESLVGLEGIGLANVVRNAQEVLLGREEKRVGSMMTYDDGEFLSMYYLRERRDAETEFSRFRELVERDQTPCDPRGWVGMGLRYVGPRQLFFTPLVRLPAAQLWQGVLLVRSWVRHGRRQRRGRSRRV